MNVFHHAGFWPFEVVFIDQALRLHAPVWLLAVLIVVGLVYARYVGGLVTDTYNTFPQNLKIGPVRAIFVIVLIVLPIGVEKMLEGGLQIASYVLHVST